ncbi:YqgE/AlgH family protein [Pasteurella atlantica]|uniref:YqgE/AlgH family protein n=2 Tax=Pasteurellaceae TaxID=712 RepID=A0ACC6HPL9_9PAST|nr:YqgE/AlgH family protein [Pasteurella atlantica]MDP8052748.1 YqgE/AlgH family protein [Pasteurella atlantica]MDP8106045.1 YqgE/AlgH family protein [Pasteurella atlantica]MDP8149448.1 YqgE/AlgH family protein [Pasteurella atlantica]
MTTHFKNHFLIATPDMDDDYFSHTVIYLCEHTDEGAMGLVVSVPTDLSVMELLAKMDFMMANQRDYTKDQIVLSGGPVKTDRGFILHTKTQQDFMNSQEITPNIYLTTSGDILDVLGTPKAPERFLVCLGCATWQAEQLEHEIAKNYWLVTPADEKILFETGYMDRWSEAKGLLGIDGILAKAGRA